HRLPAYDVVVACQNVADVYPALERLRWRPPLIEFGDKITDATAGPKHLTARYVATSAAVRDAAAPRMSNRVSDAIEVPPIGDRHNISAWRTLLLDVMATRQ